MTMAHQQQLMRLDQRPSWCGVSHRKISLVCTLDLGHYGDHVNPLHSRSEVPRPLVWARSGPSRRERWQARLGKRLARLTGEW